MDVLPIPAVLKVPVVATASEIASRLGVRFVVRGAIQMTKGVWRLSMEVFDARTQNPLADFPVLIARSSLDYFRIVDYPPIAHCALQAAPISFAGHHDRQ